MMAQSHKATGTVAARIQAFQAGWHTNHIPVPGPPPRRSLTLTHTNDGGFVVGRGRRRDLSFASPTSRAEGTVSESNPAVGLVPHVTHPAYEEKEVYFRPFSRASQQSLRDNANEDRDISPQTVLRAPSADIPKRQAPAEYHDGTNELQAIRSRLRSIVERKESDAQQNDNQNEEKDLSINDLGNLLDDAIGQHSSDSLPIDSNNRPVDRGLGLTPKDDVLPPQSPLPLVTIKKDIPAAGVTAETSVPENTIDIKSDGNGEVVPDAGPAPVVDDSQPHVLAPAEAILSKPPVESKEDTSNIRRRGSIFQRYNSRAFGVISKENSQGKHPEFGASKSVAPQPISSPVKQRAAMFDSPEVKPQISYQGASIANNGDVGHKATWSQYQASSPRRFSNPFRNTGHHRHASSGMRPSSALIPLTLPQMVEEDVVLKQQTCAAERIETEINNLEVPFVKDNNDAVSEHNMESDPSEVSATNGDTEEDSIPHATAKGNRESYTVPPSSEKSNILAKKRPSKWDLLQRSKFTSFQKQIEAKEDRAESIKPSRSARSSIVENRIQDLMNASKQLSNESGYQRRRTVNSGKSEQEKFAESVADHQPLVTKNIPALQMPINEQAEANKPTSSTQSGSSRANTEVNTSTDQMPVISERSTSPIKSKQEAPLTPIRGRPKKVKQSLSPRGIPYAIEQRFSLSPSRSRSRRGESGVFVSVEVRNSPERNSNGSDAHEVIVRASVEPEDIFEDTDE